MYAMLFCSCLWIQSVLCNLHSKFKEFDELTPDNFTVVVKRDAMSGQVRLKIVTLFALRKYFVLYLVPGSPVLRKDFEAHMVDADGRMTPVHVDHQIFYTGYLNNNPQHGVDAVHTDHLWIAQIHGPDDVYSIEPLTHHVADSPTTSMLIFRQRDINSSFFMNHDKENATLQPFCEEVKFKQYRLSDSQTVKQRSPNKKNTVVNTNLTKRGIKSKGKNIDNVENKIFNEHHNSETRSSKDKHSKMQFIEHQNLRRRSDMRSKYTGHDTCEILVIADFEAYKGSGKSNILRVISFLVYLYQGVDRIFRGTYFGTFTNLGLVIARIIVHTEYTKVVDDQTHYNMANNAMSALETLVSMTSISNFSNFCLVHLTTQRGFGGTLGIAATAEQEGDTWGNGICARSLVEARNVGLSTLITARGQVLPFRMYLLVIAHEIGHNWGSDHDPKDDYACSPSSRDGGKYIMWAYSGNVFSVNSKKFSPCSRRSISTALNAKTHTCFMPRSHALKVCGNLVVDPGEDCDVGYLINDPCCNGRCSFAENAVCSPFNHPCCTNSCQIAPPTQKCFVDIQDCHETAFCSGTESHTCPQPQPLPNNSTCQSLGRCWHGKCVSFCELLGATFTPARRLVDCTCDSNRITMCYHCCWDPENKQGCIQMGGPKIDGSPCMMGFCDKGKCEDIQKYVFIVDKTSDFYFSGSNYIHQLGRLNTVLLTVSAICVGSQALIILG